MRLSLTGRAKPRNNTALMAILLANLIWPAATEAKPKKSRQRSLKSVQARNIDVDVRNVFDLTVPGENIWLFRLANFIHIPTRTSVIRRELLVHPGDWTDLERVEESERELRGLPFIKAAKITSKPTADGREDLVATTQDAWTTQPQINIASEGGQSSYSAGFEEINLLGYGKDVNYLYKKTVDGVSQVVGYSDPQFLNTRAHLATSFQDNPGGSTQHLSLDRPFYSLTTRTAAGVSVDHARVIQKIFQGGQLINQYDQEHLALVPTMGVWVNNDPLNVLRLQLFYRYTEDIFRAQSATTPGSIPPNKALSGPIVSASFIQSDFIKETFVDKTGRVEDINLGHQTNAGVGYVDSKLGATENSVPFSANDSFGFGGDGLWFGLVSYGTSTRYRLYNPGTTAGRLFNTIYFANFNYYRHLMEEFPMTGVVHLESAYLQNPDTNNVLSLGGNTGLRGFKVDSFTGNKSVLLNLEDRFYLPQEVFHLAYVGGAVFFDAGQVQPQGQGYNPKDFHVDVGLGMRFGLSRSADGTVFRVDLAYAVGPIQQANRWILSVSSNQGFRREANTYSNFSGQTSTQ